jgi:hypothetical protein
MGCNNPSELISSEIQAVHGKRPDLILSIGTGMKTPGKSNKAKRKQHRFLNYARENLKTARKLPDIATDAQATHTTFQTALLSGRDPDNKRYPMYFRFNVPDIASKVKLDQWIPLDDSEPPNGEKTLQLLRDATNDYLLIQDVAEKLADCAKELVRVRRERAKTERWERFATNTVYECPKKAECKLPHFPSRGKLRMHLSEHHQFVPRVTMMDGRPVCLIDQCMETPQLHNDDRCFLTHLRDHHSMKDAIPMETSHMENWLNQGRLTEVDVLKQEQEERDRSNPTTRQPSPANNPDGQRRRRSGLFRRRRRSPSLRSERDGSLSDSQ